MGVAGDGGDPEDVDRRGVPERGPRREQRRALQRHAAVPLPGPTPPPETVAWCGVCGSEWLGDFIDAEITEVYGATYYYAV